MSTIGYNAITFERPAEFLQKLDPNQPGCLVLDVRMPEMSGLQSAAAAQPRAARCCP